MINDEELVSVNGGDNEDLIRLVYKQQLLDNLYNLLDMGKDITDTNVIDKDIVRGMIYIVNMSPPNALSKNEFLYEMKKGGIMVTSCGILKELANHYFTAPV